MPAGCQYVITLNAAGQPVCDVPVALHETIRDEWFLTGDQRHRVSVQRHLGHRQGLPGQRPVPVRRRGLGDARPPVSMPCRPAAAPARVRANGTIIARNSFDLPNYHRTDVRVQRRFGIGRARLEGIVEVFNVFNHANYGTFVLNESNSRFGQPDPNLNVAYQPRMVQLGFRASF